MATTESTTVAVSPVAALVSKFKQGDAVDFDAVTSALRKQPEPVPVPAKLPVPTEVTETQKAALEKILGIIDCCVPKERRLLTTQEISDLMTERLTLDEIGTLVAERTDNIRTTILNHMDVFEEEQHADEEGWADGVQRDKDGHYVLVTSVDAPGTGQRWSREVRGGSAVISTELMRALAKDPKVPEFTHEDFLACTEQTRVFDEHRFMLWAKRRPEILNVIGAAMPPTPSTASLYKRKPTKK